MGAAAGTQQGQPATRPEIQGSWDKINTMEKAPRTLTSFDGLREDEFEIDFESGAFGIQLRINVRPNANTPDRFDELPGAFVKNIVCDSQAARKAM